MTYLVLGNGQIGGAVAADLRNNNEQVVCVDSKPDAFCHTEDLSDPAVVQRIIEEEMPQVVVCALPAALGYQTVKAAIEAGQHIGRGIVDVSFCEENLDDLDDLAKSKGVKVIHDAGLAPGIPNMIIGQYLNSFSALHELRDVRIFVGGVARVPEQNDYGYVLTWNTADMVSEFRRPARCIIDGKITKKMPLDTPILPVQVGPYIFESFISDGCRSLLNTKIPYMVERTLRWPGHVDKIRSLIKKDSELFFSEASAIYELEKSCSEGEDLVALRIDVDYDRWESIIYARDGRTAMQRSTAGMVEACARTLANPPQSFLSAFPATGVSAIERLPKEWLQAIESILRADGIIITKVAP